MSIKQSLQFIKSKVALLGAVIIATAVGGATTAMVLASIPDSSGVIHGCYQSNGSLKVIDSATACPSNSTALNWSQNGGGGPIAYAHLLYDNNTGAWTLDASRSKNITSFYSNNILACLTVNQTPKNIAAVKDGGDGFPSVSLKDQNGWSSVNSGDFCDQNAPGSNIAFSPGVNSALIGAFLTVF